MIAPRGRKGADLAITCCENTGFAEPKRQMLPASVEGGRVHKWLEVVVLVGTSSRMKLDHVGGEPGAGELCPPLPVGAAICERGRGAPLELFRSPPEGGKVPPGSQETICTSKTQNLDRKTQNREGS